MPTPLQPRASRKSSFSRKGRARPYAPTESPTLTTTSNPGFKAIGTYKTITRRWLGIMVGFPLVVVTSYVLYKRVFLGHKQISLVLEEESISDLGKAFLGVEQKPSVSREEKYARDW
ncbi:hypothetical protein N7G274_007119 [Stereocaulon virgatum]|uniref:Uncharacterized protein n=1 Tax=Stereocaulon virgatum TaxID=373712 RepID=A0ABR4A5K3_9LECA